MFKDLVIANRSYRRFYQNYLLSVDLVTDLIDNARLSASAANLQSLRYIIVCEKESNERVFSCLRWAGYLTDWEGPEEGERPSAYIIMLGDKEFPKFHQFDGGIAAQSIFLGAVDKGLGGCIFASVDKERLQQEINIPVNMEIIVVIALGKPKEQIIIETADTSGDIKYWRDENQSHHVPKRKLADILIEVIS